MKKILVLLAIAMFMLVSSAIALITPSAIITDSVATSAVTTGWTDGTDGTGVALLTFTTPSGAALTAPISGMLYFTEAATGLAAASLDTGATAAKGQISPVVAAGTSFYHYITNATGELDLTLTSNADSYWIVFTQPDGTLLVSDELAITGP